MKLSNEELKNISGGISISLIAGIGAILALLAGLLDGITRPLRCR